MIFFNISYGSFFIFSASFCIFSALITKELGWIAFMTLIPGKINKS